MPDLPPPASHEHDPPPDTEPIRPRPYRRALWVVGMLLLFMLVICYIVPMIVISSPRSPGSREISNIKQVGLALYNFEQDYGSFPDAGTVAEVRKRTGSTMSLGTRTANDYLRQLIAAEHIDTEKSFYARIKDSRRPDNLMDGTHALEKGECGFAYIIGPGSSSLPSRPLLVTPLIPGTDRFDPRPFDGKAIIFWTDSAAIAEKIQKDGHVIDKSGNNLLDPANPVWNGKPPVIAWPE
jgi:hypothetical protein